MSVTYFEDSRNSLPPKQRDTHFKYALAVATVVEVGVIVALMLFGQMQPVYKQMKPKPHVIAVQMVKLPLPPEPVIVPKPTPPKPIPPKPVERRITPPPPTPHQMPIPPIPKTMPPAPFVKHLMPPAPIPVQAPSVTRPVVVPSPPPLSPQQTASLMGKYTGMLRPMIQRNLHVPSELRAMGLSGQATIEFEISPQGRLLWAKVIKKSQIGAVNRAALAAVRHGGFPAFLKKMPKINSIFQIDVEVGAGQ